MDNQILLGLGDRKSAIQWVVEDQNDEFWLDPVYLADMIECQVPYIARTMPLLATYKSLPFIKDTVPKANGMWRDGLWMHPIQREIYHLCLSHIISKTDHNIPDTVYSYRKDTPIDNSKDYPFAKKMNRWKRYCNDFRRVALEEKTQYILCTDLTAYYDHISIDNLINKIRLLMTSVEKEDENALIILRSLLNIWGNDGYGIPQNYDPSSYFGSLYLYNVDRIMQERRFTYFRYVDDFRVCCQNEKHAIRALSELQGVLARDRLYLNSGKTKIIKKGSPEFAKLLDVDDDNTLSKIEDEIHSENSIRAKSVIPIIKEKLEYHFEGDKDDRKLRAYLNRFFDVAELTTKSNSIYKLVKDVLVEMIVERPDRSDAWVKYLSYINDDDVTELLYELIFDEKVVWNWHRYNMLRYLITERINVDCLRDRLSVIKQAYSISPSELEQGVLLILIGRLTNRNNKPDLYADYFSRQSGYFKQRCLIISLMDAEVENRNAVYDKIHRATSEHDELIDCIKRGIKLHVGIPERKLRIYSDNQKQRSAITKSGIGLINGKMHRYRMSDDVIGYD